MTCRGFTLLAIHDFTHIKILDTVAGWEGIICGGPAVYLAMAEMLNEQYGRTVLPIG
ncbi:acetate uptake transporter [Pseudodesulfovibrio sediminis]|uniref:Uncharacterized protein n=1 Tax=Pseudodesulfovibrio sediminis TaxID=2810563 RepID=A0ABN6ES52_9BACT|nr:hypothetical protein PSDVSF_13110 [Pseudodesulfovibrio sediminis]